LGEARVVAVGILEDATLEIANEDSAGLAGERVAGIDGDFAAASRGVDDVLGHGVAGGVAAEGLHDLESLLDAGPEVGAPCDEVALVQVVGPDAAEEELVDEGAHDFGGVVDVAKEDGLVAQGDAGVGEAAEGVAYLGGDFTRVIGVDGDEEGVELAQGFAQGGRDALGEEDGDAGANADELDVGDGAESSEELGELVVGEEEGIAAATTTTIIMIGSE
jgi:hypothetical protein